MVSKHQSHPKMTDDHPGDKTQVVSNPSVTSSEDESSQQTQYLEPSDQQQDTDATQLQMASGVEKEVPDDQTAFKGASLVDSSLIGKEEGGRKKDSESMAASSKEKKATQFTEFLLANNSNMDGIRKAKALMMEAKRHKGKLLKNRFLLDEILGRGGMGVVYRAIDLRKVEAEDPSPFVAAKVLNESFKNHPDAFITLQQETVKSQELAHPNIVTVHDFDRDGNTIYMTMELLEGTPLDGLLRAYKDIGLEQNHAIKIFDDLCAGLAYAHDRQLIHSDFKPGNIYITSSDTAKVLDFGIARAASSEKKGSHFDPGQLGALTPTYASLEMLLGEEPHYSDDVFALACVFYEMLTGKHPFDRLSADKALAKKKRVKRIRSLNSRQWQALEKALAFRREDRTQTIKEFSQAFHHTRRGFFIGAVGVGLLTVIGGLSWQYYQELQKEKKLEVAIRTAFEDAQTCFEQKNYICAKDNSLVVLNLEPNHSEAKTLHQQAVEATEKKAFEDKVDGLLSQATKCFEQADYNCAKVKATDVLALDATREKASQIISEIALIRKNSQIENALGKAQDCVNENDFACARDYLAQLAAIEPGHSEIERLTTYMDNIVHEKQAAAKALKNKINKLLSQARSCRDRKQYQCVINKAKGVLKISPNHPDAARLKQQAEMTIDNNRRTLAKVTKLVKEAQACIAVQKTDCADSKADAALDLMPGHQPALAVKKESQKVRDALWDAVEFE